MLARSHVALAVAPSLALLSHPLPPAAAMGPLGAPVLRLPGGGDPADPVLPVALGVAIVALAALAPDLDHAGGTLARSAGPPPGPSAGCWGTPARCTAPWRLSSPASSGSCWACSWGTAGRRTSWPTR